ncbi:MAG: FG-GAP repeat domain-containing protein [Candidatus Hodarchaeota archaeon]
MKSETRNDLFTIRKRMVKTAFTIIIFLGIFQSCLVQNVLLHVEETPGGALEEPRILECEVTDYYPNGSSVYRGTTTNLSPRPSEGNSHPLSRDKMRMVDLDEIAILSSETSLQILDDSWSAFNNTRNISLNPTFAFATGDFDGDCLDEICTFRIEWFAANFSCQNYYDLYDDAAHDYALINEFSFGSSPLIIDLPLAEHFLLEAGDYDGDGIDELFFCRQYYGLMTFDWEIFFDVFNVMNNTNLFNEQLNEWPEPLLDLQSGDFDGDGCDELAYVGHSRWGQVRDDANQGFCTMHGFTAVGGDAHYYFVGGDFDGDTCDDFFIIRKWYGFDPFWYGFDPDFLTDFYFYYYANSMFNCLLFDFTEHLGLNSHIFRDQVGADVDGDVSDELILIGYPFFDNDNISVYVIKGGGLQGQDFEITKTIPFATNGSYYIEAADVDADGRNELIIPATSGGTTKILDEARNDYAVMHGGLPVCGPVACGDFDGDSLIVNYTGNSWSSIGPEGILVALAAPPTYKGISQDYGNSYTAYGEETSTGSGNETTVGSTSMYGFSFEQSIDWEFFTIASVSFSHFTTHEFSLTGYTMQTITKCSSCASGYDDNSIVFQRTTYDCYEYTIEAHPSDPSLTGTRITIDIPVACQFVQVSQTYFNENYNLTIGEETFQHTIQEPWTYPSREDMVSIAPSRWESSEMDVGQGAGFTYSLITIETQYGSSMSEITGSEYSYGAGVAGGEYVESYGGYEGISYEIISGSACTYEGRIGHIIDTDEYNQLHYSYGLFVYAVTHPSGCSYQVINYFVEGAVPYYASNSDPVPLIVAISAIAASVGIASAISIQRKKKARAKSRKLPPGTKTPSKGKEQDVPEQTKENGAPAIANGENSKIPSKTKTPAEKKEQNTRGQSKNKEGPTKS